MNETTARSDYEVPITTDQTRYEDEIRPATRAVKSIVTGTKTNGWDGKASPLMGGVKLVCMPSVTPMDEWSVYTTTNNSKSKVTVVVATGHHWELCNR